ncbi:hypothetical protein [Halomonas korlensis]|uniref:Tetratricopeptide repeat-containing protein n=1 Tax=Halomonas korlensis TaxID=463301 RepID=A0A1I7KBP2_9GAMM|nr:hypothetical protein [Halomonas korlensis]SFU94835.1 hypothetical protein SAMN04487955_11742 [Halomonas korlensis]
MAMIYRTALATLLLGLLMPTAGLAQPALPGSFIADLKTLQTRLENGDTASVSERAATQAERLAGGNQADRWARALYLHLAARAAVRDDQPAQAADLLAKARAIEAAPAEWRRRRLQEEIGLRQTAGQWERALALLEEGLDASAEAGIWRRAALVAQRADEIGRAAAIWDAGWRLGVLQGKEDLLTLVRLHLAGGTPARGAEWLEEAITSGELADDLANRRLLAQAWQAARDRSAALEAWQSLAQRSDDGQDWLHLGQLALTWGASELAQRALQEAKARGAERADQLLASLNQGAKRD